MRIVEGAVFITMRIWENAEMHRAPYPRRAFAAWSPFVCSVRVQLFKIAFSLYWLTLNIARSNTSHPQFSAGLADSFSSRLICLSKENGLPIVAPWMCSPSTQIRPWNQFRIESIDSDLTWEGISPSLSFAGQSPTTHTLRTLKKPALIAGAPNSLLLIWVQRFAVNSCFFQRAKLEKRGASFWWKPPKKHHLAKSLSESYVYHCPLIMEGLSVPRCNLMGADLTLKTALKGKDFLPWLYESYPRPPDNLRSHPNGLKFGGSL